MKMDSSWKFKIWQKNLAQLEESYDIKTGTSENMRMQLLHQIKVATTVLPEEIAGLLGRKKGKKLMHFMKTTAGTIIELQKLLSVSLSFNLVTISEYHSISQSLNEIMEMVKKLDTSISYYRENSVGPETKSNRYWILN